jgi:hypothetical protein
MPALLLVAFFLFSSCAWREPNAIEISAKRAQNWLLLNQNPDGSWGSPESLRGREVLTGSPHTFVAFGQATSSLAMMALLPECKDDPQVRKAMEKGLKRLLAQALSQRSSPNVFCDVWTHTYRLECFCKLLQNDVFPDQNTALQAAVKDAIEALIGLQGVDGGFAYYDAPKRTNGTADYSYSGIANTRPVHTGAQSTTFNTALALRSLILARSCGFAVPEKVLVNAAACLRSSSMADGGFAYGTRFARSFSPTTYAHKGAAGRSSLCWLALDDCGQKTHKEMAFALQLFATDYPFLISAQARPKPHEGYYNNAGYYVLFGHCYAAEAAARIDDQASLQALTAKLLKIQNLDGSYFDFPLYNYGHAYGTAYALIALRQSLRGHSSAPKIPAPINTQH